MIDNTYTSNPYTQRVDELRSQVGDNPAAIANAFAQQETTSSVPLKQSIEGQNDAISQLAELDKQVASQYQGVSESAKAQTQNIQDMYGATAKMSAYDASNPQEFINRGPAVVDLNAFVKQYAPDTGLISPFAVSKSADTQSSGQGQIYDLASQQRGSLERAIGTQAEAYGNIAKYQNEQKAAEDAKKLDFLKVFGGDYELDGQTYHFDTPEEKLEKERKAKQSVLYRTGKSGKSLLDEVIDGQGNFVDIIQENPDLTEDEIIALGRANVSKFGAFKESNQQLQQMGLGALVGAGLTREGATNSLNSEQLTAANTLRDEYLKQSTDFDKISSSYNKILSADDTPAGDMGLIFGYMKILDPGSTVREGEYATAENAASIPERVRVQYNKALEGDKLSPEQRQDFKTQAGNVYSAEAERHELTKSEYERLAQQSGIDPTMVIVDFGNITNDQQSVRVRLKSTGQTGTIPFNEFDPNIYERIE